MNRRTFLQLCGFLALAPILRLYKQSVQATEPYDSSMGQWVFDGVNGLTFPVINIKTKANAASVKDFRALTFLERLFGGVK